jgi:ribonuclease-3
VHEGEGAALTRLINALPPERRDHVFTHTSWAPDRASSYERLEFLGDSVLELAVARTLYDRFPDASEGRLAKIRAHVVSRQSCAAVARTLDLGAVLVARAQDVPGPELHRISLSRNVVAPAIVEAFDERIEYASTGHVDSKTELQEALARTGRSVQYDVLDVDGPPHERRFVCAALIDGERLGTGRGTTKKAAEQEAAAEALAALGVLPPAA